MGIPSIKGMKVDTVRPKAWNRGSVAITTSVSWVLSTSEICFRLAMILRWLNMTPFGSPSLPLENKIAAGSSNPDFLQIKH